MTKPIKGILKKGIVTIKHSTGLRPGDEVIVVQPLDTPVKSLRTGKILGMDERVLGRGVVMPSKDILTVEVGDIRKSGMLVKADMSKDMSKKRRVIKHITKSQSDINPTESHTKEHYIRGKKPQCNVLIKVTNARSM